MQIHVIGVSLTYEYIGINLYYLYITNILTIIYCILETLAFISANYPDWTVSGDNIHLKSIEVSKSEQKCVVNKIIIQAKN